LPHIPWVWSTMFGGNDVDEGARPGTTADADSPLTVPMPSTFKVSSRPHMFITVISEVVISRILHWFANQKSWCFWSP